MNKKSFTFVLVFLLAAVILTVIFIPACFKNTEAVPTVIRTYTVKNKDYTYITNAIRIGRNGECVLSGVVINSQQYQAGSFVARFDSSLNPQWVKFIPHHESWAIPLKDGGIAILTSEDENFCITELSSKGNVVWSKKYTGIPRFQVASFARKNVIVQTRDGGFIVVGKGIIKLDSLGNIEWAKTYSGEGTYYPFLITASGIKELPNGNYIVSLWLEDAPLTGGSGAVWGCCNDFLIMEIDSTGNIVFARRLGRIRSNEVPNSIILNSDQSFICLGWDVTISGNANNTNFSINIPFVALDKNGNVLRSISFSVPEGSDYFGSKTPDGGYLLGGDGLIKLNEGFDVEWSKKSNKIRISFIDTKDNTFVASGNLPKTLPPDPSTGGNHFFVIKGDVRRFDSKSFNDFKVAKKPLVWDINELINLAVSDVSKKVSVTSGDVNFTDIDLK